MDNVIDEKLFSFILENVKLLLNITYLPENVTNEDKAKYEQTIKLISLYINMVCNEILIKTNRYKFPEDLKYLVIDMTVDMYNLYTSNSNSENAQVIQSMSEEGRTVNFGLADNVKVKLQLLIQKQMDKQTTLINRYKLLYKVRCPKDE